MLQLPSKKEILDIILHIRKELGMEDSYPIIKEIIDDSHLFIIVEDRPDKSIIIGSSIVAGQLRKRLGKPLTIIAETDLIEKKRRIEENRRVLGGMDPKNKERLMLICEEEKKYPQNRILSFSLSGRSLVIYCDNAYAASFSEMMGLKPTLITYRYSFPERMREYECIQIDGDFGGCAHCAAFLKEEAGRIARQEGIDTIFCNQETALKKEGDLLFIDPQLLLHRTDWELKRNERCLRRKYDRENLGFWMKEITKKVHDGLLEPNEGAGKLYEMVERCKA